MSVQKKAAARPFQFKQFTVSQSDDTMKVGTDGVLLGAWATTDEASKVLDVGTGTGLIALMMAQRLPEATIHAVEVSQLAFELARQNCSQSKWANRLTVFHNAIQEYMSYTEHRYDLIVSNPPFFSGGTFSTNEHKTTMRHTVRLPNGDLLNAVRKLLKPDGRFALILPYLEGLRFEERAKQYNLYCHKMTEVHPTKDKNTERLLMEFGFDEKPCITDQLIVETEQRHRYTEAYVALTKEFYLKM